MALTLEQESALLALLNEKRTTLPQLSAATEVTNSDLLLVNQMLADKSVTADVLKRFIAPEASTEQAGVVQLSNRIDSDSDITAATSRAVKAAKDSLLSRSANLADVGSVAETLKNLGILSAGQRAVGNGENQIPDMNLFSSNLHWNGWQKLPSGLIIQWVHVDTSVRIGAEIVVIPFFWPIAFPTSCVAVSNSATAYIQCVRSVETPNKTGGNLLLMGHTGHVSNGSQTTIISMGF